MLNIGYHITSAGDTLRHVAVENLVRSIRNPQPAFRLSIEALRSALDIDPTRYALMKKTLPYIVCAHFNPAVRRKENFVYTTRFIIDIDHIAAKGLDIARLRQQLAGDERVELLFCSPSADGLKVLFRLADRCTDAGLYSIFYKRFAMQFAQQYGLEQVVDGVTSDVSRACFVSYDPEAYYNPQPQPVDIKHYADQTLDSVAQKIAFADQGSAMPQQKPTQTSHDPSQEVLDKIRQTLELQRAKQQKTQRQYYVPDRLVELMPTLTDFLAENGIVVAEIMSIQYGQKLRMAVGKHQAEVNLFYGKKGFSVVISPRCGTSEELNKLCAQLISGFLADASGL